MYVRSVNKPNQLMQEWKELGGSMQPGLQLGSGQRASACDSFLVFEQAFNPSSCIAYEPQNALRSRRYIDLILDAGHLLNDCVRPVLCGLNLSRGYSSVTVHLRTSALPSPANWSVRSSSDWDVL